MTEVFVFFPSQFRLLELIGQIPEKPERERYDSSQCLKKLRRLKNRVGAARFRGFPGSPPAIHRISSSSNHRLRSSFCPQPTNLSNTPFLTLQDIGIHFYLDPEQVKNKSIQNHPFLNFKLYKDIGIKPILRQTLRQQKISNPSFPGL